MPIYFLRNEHKHIIDYDYMDHKTANHKNKLISPKKWMTSKAILEDHINEQSPTP